MSKRPVLGYLCLKSVIIGLFWLLEPTYDTFSWNIPWELCPKVRWRGFRKLNFRGPKGQLDNKKANFRGLIAKIGHYSLFLTFRAHL